jgi:hypothetical protein
MLCNYDQVHKFLQNHFLHWIEALVLIEEIYADIYIMQILEHIFSMSNLVTLCLMLISSTDTVLAIPNTNNDLSVFVKDSKHFVLNHRYIAEIAPLQLYSSALLFSSR